MFVRKVSFGEHLYEMGKREKTELEREQKSREKLACIEGCNLIY